MHYETCWCNTKIWQHSVGQTICMLYASMLHIQCGRCSVKTDVFYSAWECGPDGIFTSISLTFWVLLWPPSLLITSSSRSSGSILRISLWTAWMPYWCGSLVRVAVWSFKWLVCTLFENSYDNHWGCGCICTRWDDDIIHGSWVAKLPFFLILFVEF